MSTGPDILEPVACSGILEETEAAFGLINAETIRQHLAEFMATCRENGLDAWALTEPSTAIQFQCSQQFYLYPSIVFPKTLNI